MIPLIVYAGDINSDLRRAAKKGDIETVKALLDRGADVNAKNDLDLTALGVAERRGSI